MFKGITDALGGIWDMGKTAATTIGTAATTIGTAFEKVDAEKLKGWGSIAQALGGVYGVAESSKFNKKMFSMEEDRINKLNEKEDNRQKEYESVWGATVNDNGD